MVWKLLFPVLPSMSIVLLQLLCGWCDYQILPILGVSGFQLAVNAKVKNSAKRRLCSSSCSSRIRTKLDAAVEPFNDNALFKDEDQDVLRFVGSPTELPDSLEDAAELAARACLQLVRIAGRTRCRVDFDTSAGDETYTTLKSSTKFMQHFTSALCYNAIPGLMQHRQQQMMALIQAKAELATLLADSTTKEKENGEDMEMVGELIYSSDSTKQKAREEVKGDSQPINEEQSASESRIKNLKLIIISGGATEPWKGDIVRIFFPDEGSAALARRDWSNSGQDAIVPSCVQFSSLGGVGFTDTTKDVIAMYFCPRASEADSVEDMLAKYEEQQKDQFFSVFVNPVLVDMGVTGFGMVARRLRERLINTIPNAFYLRTLSWGALTRAWPRDFTVWQEDENATGGYRKIGQLDYLPSNPEVEDIYDIENNIQDDPSDKSGPGTVMNALNAFGDFVQGMARL